MTTTSTVKIRVGLGCAIALLLLPLAASAQSTKVSGTLRYGSGLLDVPVASVLPHKTVLGTYSGFWTGTDVEYSVDGSGRIIGTEPFVGGWSGDAAVALGLYDLFELGAAVHSLEGSESGGALWGAFGRLALLNPQVHGLGLAVGARYLNSPDFGDGENYAPTRLGRADRRVRDRIGDSYMDTDLSFYAVAGADLPGFGPGFLPDHDFTLSAGWGGGVFQEGNGLAWYESSGSDGWFAGAAWHLQVGSATMFTVMSEYNGFDWNIGGELDLGGVVVGAHVLGANYPTDSSVYRSRKFGLKVSAVLCGAGLCKATLRDRPVGEVVVLPPTPPDTVMVRPPLATGVPTQLCLATGVSVEVWTTEDGGTLVGPRRVPLEELRPAIDFVGTYAQGRTWFEAGDTIAFDEREFRPSAGLVRLSCDAIRQIAEHEGVPIFVMRNAREPWAVLYLPVRAGVWKAYEPAR